jgi:hypothetical protein
MTDLMVKLELKTPGELLDEIVRLRAALQKIADLPPVDKAVRPVKDHKRIAIAALRGDQ